MVLSILLAALLPSASVKELPAEAEFGSGISCETAYERLQANPGQRTFFRLRGEITGVIDNHTFTLADGTGFAMVTSSCEDPFRRGDRVTIDCTALQYADRPILFVEALAIRREAAHEPPPPPVISPKDVLEGGFHYRQAELTGVLTDAFRDDADPAWLVLAIEEGSIRALVWYRSPTNEDARISRLIDARIGIDGVPFPRALGSRRNLGPHLQSSVPARIRVLEPAPDDPFRVLGRDSHRQLCSGTVTAVWNERSLFIRDPGGDSYEVTLAPGQSAPLPGTEVDVTAFPRRNAFYTRYANALIRPRGQHGDRPSRCEPTAISARDILRDPKGRPRIDARRHGSLVRLRGKVRDGHLLGTPQAQLLLDCDGEPVNVWIGERTPVPEPASQIEVTGACIINVEAGAGGRDDVRLNGFSVALRSPEELVVLERPPWWTPAKFMTTIAIMALLIAAILVWNRMLRITVEKRGRELARAALGRAEADLRTEERTRLAVELHDTIAQSLTGVTFEINTADRMVDADTAKAHQHLGIADRTLKSCRDELRNCIWDLRGNALEERDLNEAIRQALRPHVGSAELQVRFNVPRERLSDNTVHALIRIIRELAINAVRHGRASVIRIAGGIEDETLRFSVRDDGCGFDPGNAPGILQGHFGLQGIRERVNRFDGDMSVQSAPGAGTRVTIAIRTPTAKMKDHE